MISVGVHAIALPILAQFGVFEKIKKEIGEATVTLVPTAQDLPKPDAPKKSPSSKTQKKSGKSIAGGAHKSNPNAPKVVTAEGNGSGDEDGGGAVDSGSGKAGEIPVSPVAPKPAPVAVDRSVKPEPAKPVPAEKPGAQLTPVKHVPVFVEAEPSYSPQPAIPDDLRQDALDKSFVCEFEVGPDGLPIKIKPIETTGIKELDDIALATAKEWRFKPATLDGAPTDTRIRLRIEFTVE